MLAVVKEPHIELALSGSTQAIKGLLDFIQTRYPLSVLDTFGATDKREEADDEESVDIFETDYWRGVTPGNLLQGYRLKHELTQKQLSEKCGIHHVVLSAYETGKRKLSPRAAARIANALGEPQDCFFRVVGKKVPNQNL